MKRRIFTLLGACYVIFAIMATSGTFGTFDSFSNVQETANSMVEEDHRSNPASKRLSGLKGCEESQGVTRATNWQAPSEEPEGTNSHGWIDLRKEKPKDIMATIESNCAIVWTAKWCKACKHMYTPVANLQKQGYTVYLVDYDKYQELGVHLKVKKLPTTIIFEDRKEIKRHMGVVSEETIKKTLKKNTKKKPVYVIW